MHDVDRQSTRWISQHHIQGLLSLAETGYGVTGLHNKLLKPLAQGPVDLKSYWPEKKLLVQMPHSCYHVETIRHHNSSYVTTKLHGTSACGCNNNTIFSKTAILTFLTVDVCRARQPGGGLALIMHPKVAIWRYC